MPFGEDMEIRPSKEIDEDEIGIEEEVDGVVYNIYWGELVMPWCTTTRLHATAIAFGCQWGAQTMLRKMKK